MNQMNRVAVIVMIVIAAFLAGRYAAPETGKARIDGPHAAQEQHPRHCAEYAIKMPCLKPDR